MRSMSTTVLYTAQARHRNKTKGGGTVNNFERVGRFSLGLIIGLLLVALLVYLSLASWQLYEKGNKPIVTIVKQNEKVVVGKCCLLQPVQCCTEKNKVQKPKQSKHKLKAKQTPQAVVVEEILPRAVVVGPSIIAPPPAMKPSSLLNITDPDFGRTAVEYTPSQEKEVPQRVGKKIYVVRQVAQPYYGGTSGYRGCPYQYGCDYGSSYNYPPQVIYGGTPTFVPNPPVIVPAPSVTTPAGTYGR